MPDPTSDQKPSPRKRFIAGAVCPECRIVDRIVVEEHDGVRQRRCVSCGYVDSQAPGAGHQPATRFSRRAPAPDDAANPVKILDPRQREPRTRNEKTHGKPEKS